MENGQRREISLNKYVNNWWINGFLSLAMILSVFENGFSGFSVYVRNVCKWESISIFKRLFLFSVDFVDVAVAFLFSLAAMNVYTFFPTFECSMNCAYGIRFEIRLLATKSMWALCQADLVFSFRLANQ